MLSSHAFEPKDPSGDRAWIRVRSTLSKNGGGGDTRLCATDMGLSPG